MSYVLPGALLSASFVIGLPYEKHLGVLYSVMFLYFLAWRAPGPPPILKQLVRSANVVPGL